MFATDEPKRSPRFKSGPFVVSVLMVLVPLTVPSSFMYNMYRSPATDEAES